MKKSLMTKGFVAALAAAGAFATAAYAADALTVVSWGGAYSDSQREAFYKPYAADKGVEIKEEEYNGEIAKIRAMVEAGDVTWDVVDVDTQTALQGCDEGVFETLDYSKIIDKSKMIEGGALDCAVATIVYSTIFAYDADKLKDGPTTVSDLFDTAKFPGKRGLQKSPFVNLEWALIADGVAPAEVYNVLGTPEGVDRAFKKLDTIKKDVVWWEAGAQPPQLLADGEVVIASAWNGRIFNANKEGKNFKIVWDAQAPDLDLWAIPKGAKNLDQAYDFVKYTLSAEVMKNQSKYISYGPTNQDALPLIDAAILKDLPTAPENMKTALPLNPQFWGDNGEELRNRFNTWLAQ